MSCHPYGILKTHTTYCNSMRLGSADNQTRAVTLFQHSGIAAVLVFIPIIAYDISENILMISMIVASFSMASIVSEVYFGRLSDRRGKRLLFIRVGFAASAVVFALHSLADDAVMLLVARIAGGVTVGMLIPIILAYTYESSGQKSKATAVASFYALGWLVGMICAGVADDADYIFMVSAAFFAAGLLCTVGLRDTNAHAKATRVSFRLVVSRNRLLFVTLFLRHTAHMSMITILPLALVSMGADLWHVSVAYGASMATMFIFMNVMSKWDSISNVTKFKAGICITIIVFAGLLLAKEWWHTIPFLALNGIAWALMYIGGSFYVMENSPKSTGVGIFGSTMALAAVVGPLIAGVATVVHRTLMHGSAEPALLEHSVLDILHGYEAVLYVGIAVLCVAFLISLKMRVQQAAPPTA